jgi:hypothetical protein
MPTTWNPSDKSSNISLSGGNLIETAAAATNGSVRAIDSQPTGKFYWEYTCNTITNNSTSVGTASSAFPVSSILTSQPTRTVALNRLGTIFINGTSAGITFGTLTNGTVVCIALDLTNMVVSYRIGAAGNWNNNSANNPATGVGALTITLGQGVAAYPVASVVGTSEQITANFGGSAFVGGVPSGFTAGFGPTASAAAQARVMVMA